MISKTRGVVLNYIKYRDSGIIVRVYTEEWGLQSFIVNGIRSARSKKSISIYQPFSLLELVVYWSESKDLHNLSEARRAFTPSLSNSIKKSSVILFLTEVLGRVLHHEKSENRSLFEFLWDSAIVLDHLHEAIELFHLRFLLRLTFYLGLDIRNDPALEEISHGDSELIKFLKTINESGYDATIPSTVQIRNECLDGLIELLSREVDSLGSIKSLKVLRQVFS